MCAVKIHTGKPFEPRILFNPELFFHISQAITCQFQPLPLQLWLASGIAWHYANYLTTAAMRRSTCLPDIPLSSTISIQTREAQFNMYEPTVSDTNLAFLLTISINTLCVPKFYIQVNEFERYVKVIIPYNCKINQTWL